MQRQDIINKIKNKRMPAIIAGAGIAGEVLLSVCKNEGIEVECFCDNSKKVAQSRFCGKEVIFTPDLKKKYKDAVFLVSVAAIKDAVERLSELGFTNWYAGGLLLKDLDVSQNPDGGPIDYAKFAIESCIFCHDGYLDKERLFVRSIDLIITERCSLKCRDCSNLMQYYQKPADCDTGMLLKSIDAFCAVIDEVMDFRVIGGEALMNKDWPVIFKRLIDEPKARRAILYANGTIIPNEKYIPLLRNNKALVIITDYGILSRKLADLRQVLDKNGIAYYVLKVNEWLDCSAITPHNRTIFENKQIYKDCCAKNMATLSDGKIFRCPYAANADRLSAIPDNRGDYIDLFREGIDASGIPKTKDKVRDYILHKECLLTCDYCNGRPLSGVEVRPAVQADKPLAYHKYAVS